MVRTLTQLLNSRSWIILSIGCSLWAVYEGIVKIIAGYDIEGVLDLVLAAVFTVNFINRLRMLGAYVGKLGKQ